MIASLSSHLQTLLEEARLSSFPENTPSHSIEISPCDSLIFGHYQSNEALKSSKVLKMPPRAIAEKLLSSLKGKEIFEKIEIAGPGFINFTFSKAFLEKEAFSLLTEEKFGIAPPSPQKKIIVEFSSPNIAKELHVGHLRSTIIGECIARLFEYLGYNVLRLNHIGDYGTSFGMLIAYMKKCEQTSLASPDKTELSDLVRFYKASKKMFDEDASFKKESQLEVVALQGNDPLSLKIWQTICDISKKAYQEIYTLLEVTLTDRGESFYGPYLPFIVEDLEKKGLITLSDGAKCVFLEGFQNREGNPFPLMVQKSDGGYNYDTTDMAAMYHRIYEEKADRIIVITDLGQSLHFQLIAKAAEKAGYLNPKKTEFNHVTFGLVLGADGKKFKTRSGDTEKLIDLLKNGVTFAEELLEKRAEEKPSSLTAEETKKLASSLAIAAIKYADLSCNRNQDYAFSYEKMLRFEGNTAAFLLYSYVRMQSLKRRSSLNREALLKETSFTLTHPSEEALLFHLLKFKEVLLDLSKTLMPNHLTEYLYTLAETFNAFFRDCRVEGSPEEKQRLLMVELSSRILKQGLFLLGIPTVEKM